MPSRAFDAVVFDMDGVLCDSEPFIAAAAAEALRRRYGIEVTREDFLPFVGAGEDRFISGAAGLHGVTVDLAIDKPLTYEIYLELIAASLQPVAGVHAFLADARAADSRLAVATELGPPQAQRQPGRDRRPRVHVRRADLRRARHPQEAGPGDLPDGRPSGWGCRPRAASWSRMHANGVRAGTRRRLRRARHHVIPARRGAPRGGGLRRRARLHGGPGGGSGDGLEWGRPRSPSRPESALSRARLLLRLPRRPPRPAAPGADARARRPPARSRARS